MLFLDDVQPPAPSALLGATFGFYRAPRASSRPNRGDACRVGFTLRKSRRAIIE
jgi:hypothetical protein